LRIDLLMFVDDASFSSRSASGDTSDSGRIR
jgi:hypothetical protein